MSTIVSQVLKWDFSNLGEYDDQEKALNSFKCSILSADDSYKKKDHRL